MKYPLKKTMSNKVNNYANLGMNLEYDIDLTNQYYLDHNIAVIYKKPTPIQVVSMSYNNSKPKITEAFFKTASTTDYNGLYKGRYIDFDVKETKSKTSFPLNNIPSHQVEHLRNIQLHNGIAFFIINFSSHEKYFFVPIDLILSFWDIKKDGRKSIPFDIFLKESYEIKLNYHPRLDYIKIIELLYFK